MIAVAIPCYNEAGAVEAVVAEWRRALPEAEIVVFDNNSGDGTGAIARRLGVRVVEVRDQGKGHAVRAIFEDLADRDAVILVDGDGTYPADFARALLEPVLAGRADMTVGNRKPVAELGAMSPIRGLGNVLIGSAFFALIGPGTRDLLSGYRVFGRHFREVIRPRSTGFEIEAELVGQAVARGLRVVQLDVPYRPRDRRDRQQAPGLPRRPANPRRDRPPGLPLPPLASPRAPGRLGRGGRPGDRLRAPVVDRGRAGRRGAGLGGLGGPPEVIDSAPWPSDNPSRSRTCLGPIDQGGHMSVNVKDQPVPKSESPLFYTAESLNFTRNLMRALEHEIKEQAKQRTRDAGRDTITEEDMRLAADEILGLSNDETEDPDADDA